MTTGLCELIVKRYAMHRAKGWKSYMYLSIWLVRKKLSNCLRYTYESMNWEETLMWWQQTPGGYTIRLIPSPDIWPWILHIKFIKESKYSDVFINIHLINYPCCRFRCFHTLCYHSCLSACSHRGGEGTGNTLR